jgi:hypothetical protein
MGYPGHPLTVLPVEVRSTLPIRAVPVTPSPEQKAILYPVYQFVPLTPSVGAA